VGKRAGYTNVPGEIDAVLFLVCHQPASKHGEKMKKEKGKEACTT